MHYSDSASYPSISLVSVSILSASQASKECLPLLGIDFFLPIKHTWFKFQIFKSLKYEQSFLCPMERGLPFWKLMISHTSSSVRVTKSVVQSIFITAILSSKEQCPNLIQAAYPAVKIKISQGSISIVSLWKSVASELLNEYLILEKHARDAFLWYIKSHSFIWSGTCSFGLQNVRQMQLFTKCHGDYLEGTLGTFFKPT